MTKFILVIRGPAGSGKSSLGKTIQAYFGQNVAHLRADYFYYNVCPQDKNQALDNNPLVYKNLEKLTENYLAGGYSVILDGYLTKIDKFGLEKSLSKLAKTNQARYVRVFLQKPQDIPVVNENQEVDPSNQIPLEVKMTEKDTPVATANREPTQILDEVLEMIH